MSEAPKENRFDIRNTLLTGLVFGITFFGINKVLGRFFKRDEDWGIATLKSENTISDLHTQGKKDKQLSMNFHLNNTILEFARQERETTAKRYQRYHIIPFLNSYLKKKYKESKIFHENAFKLTRAIYQESDEYKKTRGYSDFAEAKSNWQ